MMLCALSSLCHAQKIQFEYDGNGNVVKRSEAVRSEEYSLGSDYKIILSFTSSGKVMNVKFRNNRSNAIVDCHIEVTIRPISSVWHPSIHATSEKGDFDVDISKLNNVKMTYGLDVVAIPDRTKGPVLQSLKFQIK